MDLLKSEHDSTLSIKIIFFLSLSRSALEDFYSKFFLLQECQNKTFVRHSITCERIIFHDHSSSQWHMLSEIGHAARSVLSTVCWSRYLVSV